MPTKHYAIWGGLKWRGFRKNLLKCGSENFLPQRIFNANENSFPMASRPMKVLAGKGDPQIYQKGSSGKSQIIVLMTLNAKALYIPPVIMYLGCNILSFTEKFYANFPSVIFSHSPNGLMDAGLFEN